MKIRVTVTKENIKEAKQSLKVGNPRYCSCPIALALQEKFINNDDFKHEVFADSTYIYRDGFGYFSLSNPAMKFVKDFDEDKKVQPSTFYLEKI